MPVLQGLHLRARLHQLSFLQTSGFNAEVRSWLPYPLLVLTLEAPADGPLTLLAPGIESSPAAHFCFTLLLHISVDVLAVARQLATCLSRDSSPAKPCPAVQQPLSTRMPACCARQGSLNVLALL